MNTDSLKKIIDTYEYGQFNILNVNLDIRYNKKGQIRFNPFYQYGADLKKGSCGELMNSAYHEIRKKHPEYHVTRVVGTDDGFFSEPTSTHCFLFVSEENLMGGKDQALRFSSINDVLEKDPLLVDPSFNKIVSFSESGYDVRKLINQGTGILYNNSLILTEGRGVPLGINSEGDIINMFADFNSKYLMGIGGIYADSNSSNSELDFRFKLESKELDKQFSNDNNILELIYFLRKQEKTLTKETMLDYGDVVVK